MQDSRKVNSLTLTVQTQSDMIAHSQKGDLMSNNNNNNNNSVTCTLSSVNNETTVNTSKTISSSATSLIDRAKLKVAAKPDSIAAVETGTAKDGVNSDQPKKSKKSDGDKKRSKSDKWREALKSLGHEFALNTLEDDIEIDGKPISDIDRSRLYLEMINRKVTKGYVDDVINVVASENAYHPIKRYLNSLQWDGQDHLNNLLSHISSCDPEIETENSGRQPLSSLLISRWLLGCVARALDGDKQTAFKHQTPMLVFVGGQGLGKSSFFRWLTDGVGAEYHKEGALDPHSIEDMRTMVGKWIWEVAELGSSLRRADKEAVKGFITQEWHTYRKPYGKSLITRPTLCNLVGTINKETGFLDDSTGNRRYLPVNVTGIDHSYKDKVDVNQLWAQIVHLYRNGATPELSAQEKAALGEVSEEHVIENPLQTYIQMYFTVEPGNKELKCFTAEIIQRLQQFGVAVKSDLKVAGRAVNDALAPMKLERHRFTVGSSKIWGWYGIAPNNKLAPSRLI